MKSFDFRDLQRKYPTAAEEWEKLNLPKTAKFWESLGYVWADLPDDRYAYGGDWQKVGSEL